MGSFPGVGHTDFSFIEETKNLLSKDFCFANLIFKAYDTLLNLGPNSVMEANHSVYPHENPAFRPKTFRLR